MNKQLERSGVNFTQSAPNYPLLGFAVLAVICLVIGMITAFNAQNWILSLMFLLSIAGIVVFSFLHLRESKKFAAGNDNKNLDWEIAAAGYQRSKLGSEVSELARIFEVDEDEQSDLFSAYIVAEDLALRQIQQEAKLPVVRHISLAGIPFDAILVKNELITCIEVAFVVTADFEQEKINLILNKADGLKNSIRQLRLKSKIRLLLVLVTQLDETAEDELRSSLKNKFAETSVDVDIRLLDFENLQKTYAVK